MQREKPGLTSPADGAIILHAELNTEEFPSGQRGQTVNLLSVTSVVRIHPPPPKSNRESGWIFFWVDLKRPAAHGQKKAPSDEGGLIWCVSGPHCKWGKVARLWREGGIHFRPARSEMEGAPMKAQRSGFHGEGCPLRPRCAWPPLPEGEARQELVGIWAAAGNPSDALRAPVPFTQGSLSWCVSGPRRRWGKTSGRKSIFLPLVCGI